MTTVATFAVAVATPAAGGRSDGTADQLSPHGLLDILAQNNFGDTRSGGLAGPLGLFIVVLLAIATVLLVRNMNARLKRLPKQFPPPSPPDRSPVTERKAVADDSAADGRGSTTS